VTVLSFSFLFLSSFFFLFFPWMSFPLFPVFFRNSRRLSIVLSIGVSGGVHYCNGNALSNRSASLCHQTLEKLRRVTRDPLNFVHPIFMGKMRYERDDHSRTSVEGRVKTFKVQFVEADLLVIYFYYGDYSIIFKRILNIEIV